jgi:LPS export ABC transporter permease LptG/LPS export ABC transporter permease LptF
LKILDRYLIREIIPPAFLALIIFTFLLLIPPVMDELQALVAKGVSFGVAIRMLTMLIPQALGLTIPMSLLVGTLIGLGRMSGDREAVALLACGVSPFRLLRPLLLLAAFGGAAHLWVMLEAIPDANQAFRELTYSVVSQQMENDVRPQLFFTNFPGWVIYVRDLPKTGGGWKDVLIADTSQPDKPVLYMAREGRLFLNREQQTVALVLKDGTQYSNRSPDGKDVETFRFDKDLTIKLDPNTVFPNFQLMRGINELTIAQLQEQIGTKQKAGIPVHQEEMAIQQKFSFPAACVVFAIIGLALGMTVAREGKVAGFVVGIAVIFSYYILLYLAEAVTKGYYAGDAGGLQPLYVARLSRWFPNIVLLPFGIAALIWRARWAEGRIPFRSVVRLMERVNGWIERRRAAADGSTPSGSSAEPRTPDHGPRPTDHGPRRRGVVIVLRVPRLSWLLPNILDRYIAAMYLRAAALSFAALLGIFYIATFIDLSDKLFKGQATTVTLLHLLVLKTPQFVYFVIPMAALLSVLATFGLLSRTNELSVMKACGISLYRITVPLILLGFAWSTVLYGLEQQIMARANQHGEELESQIRGRPPRTANPLNRQWLIARDGAIYHYTYFDPRPKAIRNLVVYRPARDRWELESQVSAPTVVYSNGQWIGMRGWMQDFTRARDRWTPFAQRTLALEPPDYFETEQPLADMLTVPQLKRYIDDQRASGFNVTPEMVELQKKLAFPFATIVMTLLAIPFGLTTGKRGALYGIGIGIVLAVTYWIVGSGFAAIGKAGLLDPVMAGWAPNILAAGSAAYLLLTART